MFRAFIIEGNWATRVYSALFIIGVTFLAVIGVAATFANANAHANSGTQFPPPIRASSTITIAACPEDATMIGGACIPLDNWGVCRRLHAHASRVYRADAMRNTRRVQVAFRMRDIGCNWQRAFSGAIR